MTSTAAPPARKRRRGSPLLHPGAAAIRVNVTLDAGTIKRGKRLGRGKLSAGIRIALAPPCKPTT